MDFQEITKKDGTRIIFCHFEDLIPEAFGKTLEELEGSSSKQGGGVNEFIGHCPFCKAEGHKKHKLYLKSDLTVGHCFVCGRAFINVNDEIDTSIELPEFIPSPGYKPLVIERPDDPEWNIEKYYTEFDDFSDSGLQYLMGRHKYMEQLWQALEFKFMNGNVVIPFKYHNEIFYYQIRFAGNSKIRYFHPHIKKGCKPPYIIETSPNPKKFIICEGVFDAISLLIQAPDYTPMAVLGSDITEYQISFLREYLPQKILIYMDKTDISIRIAEKLKASIDYCPISIIKSNGMDPEEYMKKRMQYGKNLTWIT